jgi:hypothetical protein
MKSVGTCAVLAAFGLSLALGCGARSALPGDEQGGAGTTSSSSATVSSSSNATASSSTGVSPPCADGDLETCGSDVGACKPGTRTCQAGVFGPCEGAIGPSSEVCNGIDDDCDGQIDDGFHIGEPCKGTGTDQCLDGITTCDGCQKTGPDKVETCNGIDDNCNGIIDADCEAGDCKPTLLVTGSVPSSPNCIDFPVTAGSTGTIEYPCGGGAVTAQLGGIAFTGSVTNNDVTLDGIAIIGPGQSPDGCTWQLHHHIQGMLPSGMVSYSYAEMVIVKPPGVTCWQPCTETGTVKINWVATP